MYKNCPTGLFNFNYTSVYSFHFIGKSLEIDTWDRLKRNHVLLHLIHINTIVAAGL